MFKIVLECMNLVRSLSYENILKYVESVFPQNINKLCVCIAAGSKVSFHRIFFF